MFDARTARRELIAYRRSGPTGSTRRLIEAIRDAGVDGATLLDIGGGVGVVGFELVASGAERLTQVDASRAYAAVARREAARRGLDDRATYRHGDFVALADEIEPADVVTLDRVVCCYGDWAALVDQRPPALDACMGSSIPLTDGGRASASASATSRSGSCESRSVGTSIPNAPSTSASSPRASSGARTTAAGCGRRLSMLGRMAHDAATIHAARTRRTAMSASTPRPPDASRRHHS